MTTLLACIATAFVGILIGRVSKSPTRGTEFERGYRHGFIEASINEMDRVVNARLVAIHRAEFEKETP